MASDLSERCLFTAKTAVSQPTGFLKLFTKHCSSIGLRRCIISGLIHGYFFLITGRSSVLSLLPASGDSVRSDGVP